MRKSSGYYISVDVTGFVLFTEAVLFLETSAQSGWMVFVVRRRWTGGESVGFRPTPESRPECVFTVSKLRFQTVNSSHRNPMNGVWKKVFSTFHDPKYPFADSASSIALRVDANRIELFAQSGLARVGYL